MLERDHLRQVYQSFLSNYIEEPNEETLYNGEKFSRKMIEQNVSPEEVISMHKEVLENVFSNIDPTLRASFDFLLEVMIGYGFAYREHQSLRDRQRRLDSEIDVAASVQQSLLVGEIPESSALDIGIVSRPAKEMSGDYYHFVKDEQNALSVAVADVIGKGIPAALCMSMIKYAMDSIPEQRHQPASMLESLNRVVEQNVDPSMFITMIYGIYDPEHHRFHYASAGHEVGFHYSAKDDAFSELAARGLVLGAKRLTHYNEYQQDVAAGDMIIIMTDGVTECRTEKGFIEREEITQMIRKRIDESPQTIVDEVYRELERLQGFELRDDFTLIILKRRV